MGLAFVQIEGTPEQLRTLNSIDGLHLARASTVRPAEDRWIVYGYATAEAQAAVEERGPTVSVLESEADVEQQLASAYSDIDNPPIA